jgi:hypothetical protein
MQEVILGLPAFHHLKGNEEQAGCDNRVCSDPDSNLELLEGFVQVRKYQEMGDPKEAECKTDEKRGAAPGFPAPPPAENDNGNAECQVDETYRIRIKRHLALIPGRYRFPEGRYRATNRSYIRILIYFFTGKK